MQKNGAGMNTAATMFWDPSKVRLIEPNMLCSSPDVLFQDGKAVVNWSNKTMHVLVTVYGCAINVENPAELD